jgi:hypothetical protein
MSSEEESDSDDNACSRLKAALKACAENKPLTVEIEFNHFVTLLKDHLISPPVQRDKSPKKSRMSFDSKGAASEPQISPIFPTDAIPRDLIALANCLDKHDRTEYADTSIAVIIALIAQDDKLAFLRQNIYQEVAGYFIRRGKYIEADKLLQMQLSIVSLKGSKVLHDFVKINRYINVGNMQLTNSNFDEARASFLNALLLMETSPEKHPDQVAFLYESWSKLDNQSSQQHSKKIFSSTKGCLNHIC